MRAFLLFLLVAASLFSTPLTLETCVEIALDCNPAARAAKEGVKISCHEVGKAKAAFYPILDASASYARWQTFAFIPNQLRGVPQFMFDRYGPFNDYRIALKGSYLIYDSGARQAELRAMLAKREVAFAEEEKLQQEIALNVTTAFYSLAGNLELLEVNGKKLARAKKNLAITEKRKKVGAAPAMDVYRSKVGVAEARQELTKVRGVVRIAKGNLNTSMGLAPNLEIEIASQEHSFFSPERINLDNCLAIGLQNRPEMRASQLQMSALCQKIKKVKSEYGPQIAFEGSYGARDEEFFPNTREFYAGVGVRWNLFNGFYTTHSLREAKSRYAYRQNQHDQLALAIQQEIWRAYSQMTESWEMIQTTLAQVEDAQEGYRMAEDRYENGSATINDLLDSETALAKAEAMHVEARWNYRIAETAFAWTQGLIR